MKTKNLCLMVVVATAFSLTINALADCGSCEKPKTPCCKKQIKQKIEQKVEVKKEKEDEDIPLSKVPKKIKKAAKEAVKGIKLTEAELEDGVYELEGYVGDQKYEIKITPKGKVIKIEKEEDDGDDNEKEMDD